MPKVVCISDVHCTQRKITIPECDILISSGDYSFMGDPDEVLSFHKWMERQPARYKISVQGNHEVNVEKNWGISKALAEEACPGVYFIDEGPIEIEGIKIWCSAITPEFFDWAWNRKRGPEIKKHWDRIPDDTQILVTHGPPFGIGDLLIDGYTHVGCEDLYRRIADLKQLRLHQFGHIHNGYSHKIINGVNFVNASICNEKYKPTNLPIAIDL